MRVRPASTGPARLALALASLMLAPDVWCASILSPVLGRRVVPLVINLPVVSTPSMDRFEPVAADGDGTYIWNSWGLHQTRITRHADGSVRVIYNVLNAAEGDSWRLMRRLEADGIWREEASAEKFDDAFLLRDPVTDGAHVLASPASVRTIYSSPAFAPLALPGDWHVLDRTTRQYSGAGIGPDGTVCFKNYQEIATPIENAETRVRYLCGVAARDGVWSWQPRVDRAIGPRYAYDYLFPGELPGVGGFLAVAQRDVHRIAAGWLSAADDYVFDGVRVYKTGYASHGDWLQKEIVPALPPAEGGPIAPVQRQVDAYVDSGNRVIVNYFKNDPDDPSARGLYVVVSDTSGNILMRKKWNLPPYGHVRFFESDNNKYWLLWTGNDPSATRLHLYAVTLTTQPALDLQLGTYTDFTNVAAPQRAQENVFLAVPRGGNQRSNFIDGMMVACGTPYPAACSGRDRIFYFRIRLPNDRQ